MQLKKKELFAGILLLWAIIIHLWSLNSQRVEEQYSLGFFPVLSRFLRSVFGPVSFSIGDILYGAMVVFLLIKLFVLFRFIISRKRRQNFRYQLREGFVSVLTAACVVYILFNLLWGINYNRIGIAGQLGLKIEKYSIEDLKTINGLLIEKINSSKMILLADNKPYPAEKELFNMTAAAYTQIGEKYSFLKYKPASIKSSMWGSIGNYTGFIGYYNPFTGEAQVNTTVPAFTQPFTACHETAHQLGYAKEMEANFAGYLAASASKNTLFHYSVYADLFSYANRTLYFTDSAAALKFRKMLLPEVIADFKAAKKFNDEHRSFAEPVFKMLYGIFLRGNKQPMGMLSYDEVTGFIIAYYKKFAGI